MSNQTDWNEKTRVQLSAVVHLGRLGWKYRTKEELKYLQHPMSISLPVMKEALSKINGYDIDIEMIKRIADAIGDMCSNEDLGEGFLKWIRDPLQAPQGFYEEGEKPIKLFDWDNVLNNDFSVATEIIFGNKSIKDDYFRCDNVKFVNGMPLFPDEVKPPDNKGGIQEEFNRTAKRMSNPELKKYFNMFQAMTFSNNMAYESGQVPMDERKAGSFYTIANEQNTTYQLWREKEADKLTIGDITEDEIKTIMADNNAEEAYYTPEFAINIAPDTPYNSFLTFLFSIERIVFILRYGIYFKKEAGSVERHILRYPQYYASTHLLENVKSCGHGGVVFHGQGSGKTEQAGIEAIALAEYYSKQNTITRNFFFADRLALARQAAKEFKAMGFDVIRADISTRADFQALVSNISGNSDDDYLKTGKQRICVVNTQTLDENLIGLEISNPYGVKVKNVFFVDEGHRSYSTHGAYYTALMGMDPDGIRVALTGTPIISEKEKTTAKFGGYLDTYFYRQSIEDGFTLPIMKAKIATSAAAEILDNIKLAKQLKCKDVYESTEFVHSVARYIDTDFKQFRKDRQDTSVGSMLVAYSTGQASMLQEWFETNSDLRTAVITSKENDKDNAENETKFRNGELDIVIVYKMLQEGFNVKRLKRMYLLRHPKEHGLLQLIARLNRPYRNPDTGKWYRYGYLVDFADIEKDYNAMIQMYLKEIAKYENMTDEELAEAADGLLIDAEQLHDDATAAIKELEDVYALRPELNREILTKRSHNFNIDALREIRDLIAIVIDARQEFLLAGETEYMEEIDYEKMKVMMSVIQKRITFLNFKAAPEETLSVLDDDAIMEVIYDFDVESNKLLNTSELDDAQAALVKRQQQQEGLGDELKGLKDDISSMLDLSGKYHQYLDEQLREIWEKMNIGEYDIARKQISNVRQQIRQGKQQDQASIDRFGGNVGFARAFYKLEHEHDNMGISDEVMNKLMDIAYRAYEGIGSKALIAKHDDFIEAMKQTMSDIMRKEKLMVGEPAKRLYQASNFARNGDHILGQIYSSMNE